MNVASEVHLSVMSSGKLKGQVIRINAQGMEGALRQRNDGFTFFGCKKHDIKKSSAINSGILRSIINDFIIPSKDKETEKRHRGRHMQIFFDYNE